MRLSIKRTISKILSVVLTLTVFCAFPTINNVSAQENELNINSLESEWGKLKVGGGGFVTGIVTGKEKIYARTDVGGAYRYENGTWVQLMDFVSAANNGYLSVESIAVDPTDDNIIYLLCGCSYFSNGRTVVMRSEDAGENFSTVEVTSLIRAMGNGERRESGERLAVDPNSPNIIYCAGRTGGIIKSTDYGKTWELINDLGVLDTPISWLANNNSTPNSAGIISVLVDKTSRDDTTPSKRIFAAASTIDRANVFVSEDGGLTFNELSSELPTMYYPQRMKFDPDGNLLIMYGNRTGENVRKGAAYKYNIKTGEVTNISIPNNYSVGDITFKKNDSNYLIASTLDLFLPQTWSNGQVSWGDIFYKSTDGGKNWTEIKITKDNPFTTAGHDWVMGIGIHWAGSIELNPTNENQIFVISGNGIFTSDNIWSDSPDFYFNSKGIEETVPSDIISIPNGNIYTTVGDFGGFMYTDINAQGILCNPSLGSTASIAYNPHQPDVLVRVGNDTTAYYSKNAGDSWELLNNTIGIKSGNSAITTNEQGGNRFFRSVSTEGLTGTYYSDDYGNTWTKSEGLKRAYLEVDSINPNCIYASDGYNFYYSNDCGATFNIGASFSMRSRMAHAIGTEGKVYVASDGLKVTMDGGKTFEKVPNVLSCDAVGVGKAKDNNSPLTIYIYGKVSSDTRVGLYCSVDEGLTWRRLTDEKHQFGGLGNGTFIAGDMNTFGVVYTSSVGLGMIYHKFVQNGYKYTMINNDDENIKYIGDWFYVGNRNYNEYMKDINFTTNNGDSFEYTFTGTGIDYIAPQGGSANEYASVDIYVDNEKVARFENEPSSSKIQQEPIFSVRDLENGEHTLKVVKNGGGTFFQLDALRVYTPEEIRASEIIISDKNAAVKLGETKTLTASVMPNDAVNKDVVWSSSDESVATVSSDGTVTAKSLGVAIISAVSTDTGAYGTARIEVVNELEPKYTGYIIGRGNSWAWNLYKYDDTNHVEIYDDGKYSISYKTTFNWAGGTDSWNFCQLRIVGAKDNQVKIDSIISDKTQIENPVYTCENSGNDLLITFDVTDWVNLGGPNKIFTINFTFGDCKANINDIQADDLYNTLTGISDNMEYDLDGAGFVDYDKSVFDSIDFSGDHILKVRVKGETEERLFKFNEYCARNNNSDNKSLNFEFSNDSELSKDFTVIVCEYNKDGEVVLVKTKKVTVDKNSVQSINDSIDLSGNEDTVIKYFVWDNLENMSPIHVY